MPDSIGNHCASRADLAASAPGPAIFVRHVGRPGVGNFSFRGLAIGLSLWGFWEQSAGLKVLAVVTIVVAGVLGALEAFWFL